MSAVLYIRPGDEKLVHSALVVASEKATGRTKDEALRLAGILREYAAVIREQEET